MNGIEFFVYWVPATKNIIGRNHQDLGKNYFGEREFYQHELEFGDFIGSQEMDIFLNTPSYQDEPLNEELKSLLIKLAGPYGKIICKMYRIRKGLEK